MLMALTGFHAGDLQGCVMWRARIATPEAHTDNVAV